MRHQLIPPFILENYRAGRLAGRFDAVCLFVDTSGFTPLTTAMMSHGAEGAEAVADALIGVFRPLVQIVYARGGFIAAFAGDAFKAIFPLDQPDAHQRAVTASWQIRRLMASRQQVQNRFGTFDLAVKATVADGEVVWGIWGGRRTADGGRWMSVGGRQSAVVARPPPAQRAAYLFEGEALARCLEADPYAAAGDVVVTDAVYRRLLDEGMTVDAAPVAGYWRLATLSGVPGGGIIPIAPAEIDSLEDAAADFYPQELLAMPVRGEFRRVVTVFVNLREMPEEGAFVESLFRLVTQYAGYLCRVGRIGERDRGATLLIFWGAPVSHENDLTRALGFLLDLRVAHPNVALRAGVTDGLAYAGFVGAAQREEYTCHGTTVNLAARLMVTAQWGEVWLDEETARQAKAGFEVELAGRHQLKGFADPRPLFRLAGRRETGERALYRGAMVGRQAELAQLQAALQPLADGRFAGVITVLGEAGLGKSRLVHELRELSIVNRELSIVNAEVTVASASLIIDNSQLTIDNYCWFLCQCDDVLRQSLNPFRYWLRRYFGQGSALGEVENKVHFERTLNDLIAATSEPDLAAELERTRSVLGALVDLRWEGSLYEQLEAQGRFENTLEGLKALIKAESLRRLLVLHVEDAHWLDADSRQFLARLARNVAGYPFAVLLTARPELEPLLLEPDVVQHTVALEPLPEGDLGKLAGEVLGKPAAPALVVLLVARAEGNPFFSEQILLFLRERDLLVSTPAGFAPTGSADALPLDVQTVLVSRIDRLAADVRRVVQTAAVLGREFEIRVLAQMVGHEPLLYEQVHNAEVAAIWVALSELRYLFRHALLREAAYHMQLTTIRRDLHRLAGEAIEVLHAMDLSPVCGQLAYHYEQGDLPDKARQYLKLAGDLAREQYHNSAAIDFYERLLALLRAESGESPTATQVDEILDATVKRADVLLVVGRWSESEAELVRAMEYAALHGAGSGWASAQSLLGFLHLHRGELDLAEQQQAAAVQAFRSTGHGDQLSQALNRLGTVLWRRGAGDEAIDRFSEALELDRSRGDTYGTAVGLAHMATVHMFRNELSQALAQLQEAYRLYEALGRKSIIGMLQTNLALVYERLGEDALALESYRRSLALGRELGYKMGITRCLGNMGNLLRQLGRLDESEACLLEAVQIDDERGNDAAVAWHYANLAELFFARGDFVQSVGYFERAVPTLRRKGSKKVFAEVCVEHGEALLRLQRLEEARVAQQEALLWAQEVGLAPLKFQASVLGAKLTAAEGKTDEAIAALRSLLNTCSSEAELAEIHFDLWRLGEGREHRQAALALYSALAAHTANLTYRNRLQELQAAG